MTRHYVVAAYAILQTPSGVARRMQEMIRQWPDLLEPDEQITILHAPDLPVEQRGSGLPLQA